MTVIEIYLDYKIKKKQAFEIIYLLNVQSNVNYLYIVPFHPPKLLLEGIELFFNVYCLTWSVKLCFNKPKNHKSEGC